MNQEPVAIQTLDELIEHLERAVSRGDCDSSRCQEVKTALEAACVTPVTLLPEDLLAPTEGHYARRLIHKDPEGRFSMVAMVWGPGQGTPLHDHSGTWCVECVYRGRIQVTAYSRAANLDSCSGLMNFTQESRTFAGVGEAGALIPPFEYHVLENPDAETAVTVHVYGGEILACTVFEPQPAGGFRAERHELTYNS